MKWLIYAAVFLTAVAGVIAVIGYFLPVGHEASRSAELTKAPQDVYALVSDLNGYSTWWPENETRVEVIEAVPPSKFVTRIVGETAFGGTWTIEIAPTRSGSRLTITERGEIYNVIFRTLARFVFGYTSTMESFLDAIGKRLG